MRKRFEALSLNDKHPNDMWADIKGSIIECALKHVPYKKMTKTSQWLTPDTIRIGDRRSEAKGNLNANFQKEARKDKSSFLNKRCAELEAVYKKGHTRDLFTYAKQTKRPFSARQGHIKDSNGIELSEQQEIKKRWRECTEQLYDDGNGHRGKIGAIWRN